MKTVEIYTSMMCPFCTRAKSLLKNKGVKFTEIDITMDAVKRTEMRKRTEGATSVPQIFIDDMYIGDCDFIHRLDAKGTLNQILGIN